MKLASLSGWILWRNVSIKKRNMIIPQKKWKGPSNCKNHSVERVQKTKAAAIHARKRVKHGINFRIGEQRRTDQNNTRKNGKSFEIAGIKSNWENNGSSFLAFNTNRVKHVFFLQLNLS